MVVMVFSGIVMMFAFGGTIHSRSEEAVSIAKMQEQVIVAKTDSELVVPEKSGL